MRSEDPTLAGFQRLRVEPGGPALVIQGHPGPLGLCGGDQAWGHGEGPIDWLNLDLSGLSGLENGRCGGPSTGDDNGRGTQEVQEGIHRASPSLVQVRYLPNVETAGAGGVPTSKLKNIYNNQLVENVSAPRKVQIARRLFSRHCIMHDHTLEQALERRAKGFDLDGRKSALGQSVGWRNPAP